MHQQLMTAVARGHPEEEKMKAPVAMLYQVERVARGDGGADVAEGGGEAQHLQLRRPQRHQDGHRVVCSTGTNDPPAGLQSIAVLTRELTRRMKGRY
jgi:hypothetical protein